ncbi:MAG: prolyl oligopeptidase family serine peptidase [Spirochaetia bacterium]|nr:prolyl oligopeptidase family serine peptidase [Spirochaetia bacterium]
MIKKILLVVSISILFAEVPSFISLEGLSESKRKEYEYDLAQREKWIKALPAEARTLLDLPYVDQPKQGRFPCSNQRLDLFIPKGEGPFPLIVWIHGDRDTVAPVVQTERFEKALKDAGREVTYRSYSNYGHGLWQPDAIADMFGFFKSHLNK